VTPTDPQQSGDLRSRSFTVEHVTGEKRPVVFLHDAETEIERVRAERDRLLSLVVEELGHDAAVAALMTGEQRHG
jgi:hypothetical protein